MTKKQKLLIERHNASNLHYLWQCYTTCSYSKQNAYEYCRDLCNRLNGYDFKIIGYNSTMFSIGFYFSKDNKTMFHYETNKTSLDFIVE